MSTELGPKHNPALTGLAKTLRNHMTREERHLWYDFLRGYSPRFLRQKVIDGYIVDFYCHAARLVVELDGSQHYEEKGLLADQIRTDRLEERRLTVLRIPNNAVKQNFPGVCEFIMLAVMEALKRESVSPSHPRSARATAPFRQGGHYLQDESLGHQGCLLDKGAKEVDPPPASREPPLGKGAKEADPPPASREPPLDKGAKEEMIMKTVELYTDGACSGNPGPGGWGAILRWNGHERELSGGEAQTTNNRMELTAVIQGLLALRESCVVELWSDSKYVIDALEKGWAWGWRKKGWVKSDKKPALNPDLWAMLLDLTRQHEMHYHWVKGHADNEFNNRCDRLAVAEREKFV